MDPVLGLEPEGNENVYVGGLGMAARPHEEGFEVMGVADLVGRLVMEVGIVDDVLAAILILPGDVMGEVILAEFIVMGQKLPDAPLFLRRRFVTVDYAGG